MTIPRWLNSPLCTRSSLRPGRALLTPTWLAALAVLGVNDHLLKGAGVLPGALTGKLSDLAGMLVAPALLAALLGLRSRRGLLLCHLAVGAVFAAIKVSPAAADAWSWLMGLVGNAWIITVDPTDLIALPVLALGWRALVPAMARPLPEFGPRLAPRFAQIAAIVTGTSLSVATSDSSDGDGGNDGGEFGDDGEADWDTGWETGTEYIDIDADAYIHNGSDADIIIRTRDLLEDVQLDCSAVSDNPGLLLSQPLFGEGRTWTMPPRTNAAARNINLKNRECYAVMVEGDRLREPFVLFWRASELSVELVPGDIDDPSQHRPGGVLLAADADGELSVESSQRPIVHEIDLFPAADAYYPGLDVERLAWSDAPTTGQALQITSLDVGPDGCLALEFDDGAALPRWYLCLPADSFPFAETEWVTVDAQSGELIEITRVAGPQDLEPPPATVMVVSRGQTLPQLSDTIMAGKAVFDVELAPEETCGTVARPTELSVRYGEGAVQSALPGDALVLEGNNTTLSLWVAHAEERVVLNPTCAEGPDTLGADYEIVAVRAPIAP